MVSCQKTDFQPNETNLLLGKWNQTDYNDGVRTFERVNQFVSDNYGLAFDTRSKMVEWSSGWCGTPPLHFSEYEGIYQQNDGTLSFAKRINVNYKILECTEKQLILEKID